MLMEIFWTCLNTQTKKVTWRYGEVKLSLYRTHLEEKCSQQESSVLLQLMLFWGVASSWVKWDGLAEGDGEWALQNYYSRSRWSWPVLMRYHSSWAVAQRLSPTHGAKTLSSLDPGPWLSREPMWLMHTMTRRPVGSRWERLCTGAKAEAVA